MITTMVSHWIVYIRTTIFFSYAENKGFSNENNIGASLNSAFDVRCLDSIIISPLSKSNRCFW